MASEEEIKKLIAKAAKDIEKQYRSIQQFEAFSGETVEEFVRRFIKFEETKNDPIPVKETVSPEFADISYKELLDMLNQYDHGFEIRGGVSEDVISASERDIGYAFPRAFREYLKVFGGMNIGDAYKVGYGNQGTTDELLWITKLCKDEHGLPDGYLCLEYDAYLGYITCLDLQSNKGDNAPVMWYLFKNQKFDGVESINYDIYFRNTMQSIINSERKK